MRFVYIHHLRNSKCVSMMLNNIKYDNAKNCGTLLPRYIIPPSLRGSAYRLGWQK